MGYGMFEMRHKLQKNETVLRGDIVQELAKPVMARGSA